MKTNEPEPVFDDEDTRSFYEDLPQLRLLVPGVLFGDSDPKTYKGKKQTESKEGSASEEKEASTAKPATDGEKKDVAKKRAEKKEEPADSRSGDAAEESEKKKSSTSAGGVALEELLQRLPNCVNRDLIDKASVDFCYINSKGNRKKLIKVKSSALNLILLITPLLRYRLYSMHQGRSWRCFHIMHV